MLKFLLGSPSVKRKRKIDLEEKAAQKDFCRLKYATRPETESKMMMITLRGGGGRGALTSSVLRLRNSHPSEPPKMNFMISLTSSHEQ